jgi:hypothetical protein
VWQDRGHAGAAAIAFDDRRVADADAADIGDRIERAGRVDAGCEAEIARARPRLRERSRNQHRQHQHGSGGSAIKHGRAYNA